MHPFEQLAIPANGIGIHWFGQNSFALKDAAGTILLVDPYFPAQRPAEKFIHAQPPLVESELKTDYVVLTHDHGDHTCPESLVRINAAFPHARFYGPAASMTRLKELGFPTERLGVVRAGATQYLGNIVLDAVWSKPPDGDPRAGIPAPDTDHLGYVIEMGIVRVYVSGDPIHTFAQHDALMAPIAALKPDIGLLTTHPTEGEFPDFAGSVEMAVRLGLKAAVPSHYGCFVQRTYDPRLWAAGFPPDGPEPLIIPYNQSIVYQP